MCAVAWTSQLDAAFGAAQLVVGGVAVYPAAGTDRGVVSVPCGEGHAEALLVRGTAREGTWRLELRGPIEPGSLRPLAGEVLSVTPDAAVFRTHGKAGERFVLAYRARP